MSGPVQPSGYVGWASATGATNVTEPTDAQKSLGWAVNQVPPSSYENWIHQKQDQWIQYLDWKSRLETLLEDDFTYLDGAVNSSAVFGASGTIGPTNLPKWVLTEGGAGSINQGVANNLSNVVPANTYPGPLVAQGLGVVYLNAGTSTVNGIGRGQLHGRIGNIGSRDFRMRAYVAEYARGATACSIEIGLWSASGVATGAANLLMGFEWTGPSGIYGLAWQPSGQGATSLSLATPAAYQAWTKLEIESRGPTLAAYINGTFAAAVPAVPFGASGVFADFGARCMNTTGTTGIILFVDKLHLSAVR